MKEILDGLWEITKIASLQVLEYVGLKIEQFRKGIVKRGKDKNKEKVKQRKRSTHKDSDSMTDDCCCIQEEGNVDGPNEIIEIDNPEDLNSDHIMHTQSTKHEQVQPYDPNQQLELFFSDQNGLQISLIAQNNAEMNQELDQQQQFDTQILSLLNQQENMMVQPHIPQQNKVQPEKIENEDEKQWWQRIVEGYREEDTPAPAINLKNNLPLYIILEVDSQDQEDSSINPNDLIIKQKEFEPQKMKKTKKIKRIRSFPASSRRQVRIINLIDLVTDEENPKIFQIPLCTKIYE